MKKLDEARASSAVRSSVIMCPSVPNFGGAPGSWDDGADLCNRNKPLRSATGPRPAINTRGTPVSSYRLCRLNLGLPEIFKVTGPKGPPDWAVRQIIFTK